MCPPTTPFIPLSPFPIPVLDSSSSACVETDGDKYEIAHSLYGRDRNAHFYYLIWNST